MTDKDKTKNNGSFFSTYFGIGLEVIGIYGVAYSCKDDNHFLAFAIGACLYGFGKEIYKNDLIQYIQSLLSQERTIGTSQLEQKLHKRD